MNKIFRFLIVAVVALLISTPAVHAVAQSNFALRTLDGRTITSESLRGRVVVLAFGASWLPLTRAQVQGIQQLANEYGNRVEVFWVSTDSEAPKSKNFASDEQLRQFAEKNNLRVTVLRDADGAISKSLGVDQVPAVIIINSQGDISGAPIGGVSSGEALVKSVKSRIDPLL